MIDPKRLLLPETVERLKERGFVLDLEFWNRLESERKALQIETQNLQNTRNTVSKEIGLLKKQGQDTSEKMYAMQALHQDLTHKEKTLEQLLEQQTQFLLKIPNIPHLSVPFGRSEEDNVVVSVVGEIPQFDFQPLDHVALGEKTGSFDFSRAAYLSGARFGVIKGPLAQLHRAIAQFMLKVHTEQHGYVEVQVPLLVGPAALQGTGQLPNFEQDLFALKGERLLYLIPTAEVPLSNLVANHIVDHHQLPLKFVSHTPCFRGEAGSYGKDTRGMFRQHQFEKVELVWVVEPEYSYTALEQLTTHAERILQLLNLPYRKMALCTADLGFASAKTYDLEVWLPGQGRYREISSCSNTESFQAKRMQARFRCPATQKTELLHTLNGSGLAVGRTLIAVMENYQQADGSIRIPEVLLPWMNGLNSI